MLGVADWLPTLLPATSPIVVNPDATYMPLKTAELFNPEELPETAIPAIELPCTLVAVVDPTDKLMPIIWDAEVTTSVYIPVPVLLAKPRVLPVI